jgi:hypothetical protein
MIDNINMDSTIAVSMIDNINMDSTIAVSMIDNINMDSTIAVSMNDNISMDQQRRVEFLLTDLTQPHFWCKDLNSSVICHDLFCVE